MMKVGSQNYQYDDNGNLTSDGARMYVFSDFNELEAIKFTTGQTIASYTYDEEGKRKSATTSKGTVRGLLMNEGIFFMKVYSKLHIEQFDDIYENEFVLPILTSTMPDEVIEYDDLNCESYIMDKLKQNYCLLLKVPSFPKEKLLKKIQVLESNNISTLYKIDNLTYDNHIWNLLNAYEYAKVYTFFLMKNIDNVKSSIPFSSSERIKISNSTLNKITILRFEMNEAIELLWN